MKLPPIPADAFIVGLGEVLYDCFPDKRLLGGAPVNFAFHAAQLLRTTGKKGAVASAIGSDALGSELRESLTHQGIATDYLQVNDYPTGTVQVTFDDSNQPHYEIVEGVAWDHLEFTPGFRELASQSCVVCFGTLAQRSVQNRELVRQFLESAGKALRVCDLNFRPPFVEARVVEESLRVAHVVKLSADELTTCAQLLNWKTSPDAPLDELARHILHEYDVQLVAVTQGVEGTLLFTEEESVSGPPVSYPKRSDADSVGAGDAACAGLVAGLVSGMSLDGTLDLANRCGAFVASQSGAMPDLPLDILNLVASPL